LRFILGVVASAVLVVVVGLLQIQIQGAALGAIYDLNNDLVAVTPPRTAYLAIVALPVFCAGVLVLTLFAGGSAHGPERSFGGIGLGLGALALTAAAYLTGTNREAAPQATRMATETQISSGWLGWLQEGGQNSAVHLVCLLAFGVAAVGFFRIRSQSNVLSEPDQV
tara:strand:+ start:398 stop:898 length:501 start_codon:yes stop_codon:yes gene_type:complete